MHFFDNLHDLYFSLDIVYDNVFVWLHLIPYRCQNETYAMMSMVVAAQLLKGSCSHQMSEMKDHQKCYFVKIQVIDEIHFGIS